MQGLHLTADLSQCGCESARLTDADALLTFCLQAVSLSGLRGVNQLAHRFPDTEHGPGGVTATVLLAESHLCIHTWPEQAGVTIDVYVCNFGADHSTKAHRLMDVLIAWFAPQVAQRQSQCRGAMPHG